MERIALLAIILAAFAGCMDDNDPGEASIAALDEPMPVVRNVTISYDCADACWNPWVGQVSTIYDTAYDPGTGAVAVAARGKVLGSAQLGAPHPQETGMIGYAADGHNFEWFLGPFPVPLEGYGMASSVAFDGHRIHAMFEQSGTLIGGAMSVGTPVDAGIMYGVFDVASKTWTRSEHIVDEGRLGMVRVHDDALVMMHNMGNTLYVYEMNTTWTELPPATHVASCWYPEAPYYDGTLWLSCDSENVITDDKSAWLAVRNGSIDILAHAACAYGDVWQDQFIASECGGAPRLWSANGSVDLASDADIIFEFRIDSLGRIHTIGVTDFVSYEAYATGYRDLWLHEVFASDGSRIHQASISERIIYAEGDADGPHNAFPRDMVLADEHAIVFASSDLMDLVHTLVYEYA